MSDNPEIAGTERDAVRDAVRDAGKAELDAEGFLTAQDRNDFALDLERELDIVAIVLADEEPIVVRVISAHRTMEGAERQAKLAQQRYGVVKIAAALLAR